jgi:hypothetical protein
MDNCRGWNRLPSQWHHFISSFALSSDHIRRTRPFHVLAKANCRIKVRTIIYSLIHFSGSTSMGRFRIEIFGGPRNLPTTTVVGAEDKPTSFRRFLAPRTLLFDCCSAALAVAVPRNSILTRLLIRHMWLLAVRRRHLSYLHTFNHLRETSAALCRDEGSNFRIIKCETSSGISEMISTLLGTNRPTTRNRDLKNTMLLLLFCEHDWRSGWELRLIYVLLVTVDCEFRFRLRTLVSQNRARMHVFSCIYGRVFVMMKGSGV